VQPTNLKAPEKNAAVVVIVAVEVVTVESELSAMKLVIQQWLQDQVRAFRWDSVVAQQAYH
jgi:hypothetical protein